MNFLSQRYRSSCTGSKRTNTAISRSVLFSLVVAVFFLSINGASAVTYYSRASTAWNVNTTWSLTSGGAAVGGGIFPGINDNVIIENFTVSVTAAASCNSISFTGNGTASGVTISTGITLNVTNSITVTAPTGNVINAIAVGAGTLNAGSIALLSVATGTRMSDLTLSTGTINISGNLTVGGANSRVTFTGGGTINASGTFMSGAVGTFTRSSGTVNYSGTTQTITNYQYANLIISGSGTKTLAANTTMNAALTVRANCTLAMVTFTIASPTSVVLETVGGAGVGSIISSTNATAIITLAGNLTLNYTGTGAITTGATMGCGISLGANRSFIVAEDGTGSSLVDLTITGVIGAGAFNILKQGGGELMLSGANAFTGTLTVENGTLLAGANAPSGSVGAFGNAATAITLGNAATTTNNYPVAVWINGSFTITRTITIANQATTAGYNIGGSLDGLPVFAGAITFNQPFTVSQVATTGGNFLAITGGIVTATNSVKTITFDVVGAARVTTNVIAQATGTTSLLKRGIGSLTLSTANAYTGSTTISGGSLIAGANIPGTAVAGPFGNSTAAIVMGDATTNTLGSSPALLIGGAFTIARDVTIANFSTAGTYSIGGSTANASSLTNTAAITFSQPFSVTQITGGTLTLQGGITGGLAGAKTVTFDHVGGVTVNTNIIADGTGTTAVRKINTGTLTMSVANTYTAGTTINDGLVAIGNANGLGAASSALVINNTGAGITLQNSSGGSLTLANHITTWTTGFTVSGTQILQTGTGAITLAGATIPVTVGTGMTYNINGPIIDAARSISKAGAGVMTFGTAAMQVHDLVITAGTFSSTSGVLSLTGDFDNTATFAHNAGTIAFNGTTVQAITSTGSSFSKLVNANTSATVSALSAITTLGLFTTLASTTTDMKTFPLVVASASHAGTLLTQDVSATPITASLTWGGTVSYNSANAQTIVAGSYATLNGTGGNRAIGNVTINISNSFVAGGGVFTLTAGNTFNYNGSGTQTITAGFDYYNLTISGARGTATLTLPAGTIGVSNAFNASTVSGTITWATTGNIFDYNGAGAQTIFAPFTYYDLVVSNAGVKAILVSTIVTCRTLAINDGASITVPSTTNSLVVTL